VVGILGGLIGTYVSFKKVGGPKERAFVIEAAIIVAA
jgi:hypothetical protein